ncbi:MAG: hypothetical protein NC191_02170 [Muribaculaceae bacterium]|nr:hypothetical protein [Muribaculaceae bacterium]
MSDEFKTLIKEKQREFFIPEFVKTYNANFTDTVPELTDRNKYRTIVSYLSIPRASKYIVKKPNGDEIYLPLTASLSFVNILTGETLYSTSETVYGDKLFDNNYNKISEHYVNSYKNAISKVVEKAKQNFHPFEITVKVKDNYRNLYVLDKGSEAGISEDDLLFDSMDNQLSVIYSTLNYSVAKPLLADNIKLNSEFTKQSNNGGINQIKKPKVLLINDMNNSSIYDLLMTNLGQDSKINLITTNPTFNKMRNTVIDLNNNFKSTNIVPKNLPDYFLVFSFTPPAKTLFKLNQSGLDSTYYQMFACGTMFDKTGKIVFAQCADDITEPRYSNKKYDTSENDLISILYKNLIEKISKEINTRIEFKEYEYKIKKVDNNEIILEDKSETLSENDSVVVYKKHKGSNGTEYLLPAFKYRVITIGKGIATCTLDYPFTDDIEKASKSNIVKASMIVTTGGANSYKIDTSQMKSADSDVYIENLENFIEPIIGTNFKKPLTLDDKILEDKINSVNDTLMFKNKLNITQNNSDLRIVPFYEVKLKKHKIKGYTKIDTYSLLTGVKIMNKEKVVSTKTLTQNITITLPLKNEEATLQMEMLKIIYPTLQQIIGSLK